MQTHDSLFSLYSHNLKPLLSRLNDFIVKSKNNGKRLYYFFNTIFKSCFFQRDSLYREAKRDFNQEFKRGTFSRREINLINYAIRPVDEFFFLLEVNKSELIGDQRSWRSLSIRNLENNTSFCIS